MFDPPTPDELIHNRFRDAAVAGDAQTVREILAKHPNAVNDTQRMQNSVLQAVCLRMFSFDCKPEHIETMLAIVEAGGDMAKNYNYSDAPIATLLRRGVIPALRALQDKGWLADAIMPENRPQPGLQRGVQGVHALTFLCVSKQWQDLDRQYPLGELVELLLEAGARPCVATDADPPATGTTHNSACAQLLSSLDGMNRGAPNSAAQALALLMEHDHQTKFNEAIVLRAWRSKIEPVFQMVIKRYFDQGGTHENLQEMAKNIRLKPELAAKLQSDALKAMTTQASVERSKPGVRF